MSGVSKPYSELYSPVRNDARKFHLQWRFALKIGAVQDWLKMEPKNCFSSDEIKKNLWNAGTGALKSRGITLKANISFVSVYLQ
jgi:hypothetical protein